MLSVIQNRSSNYMYLIEKMKIVPLTATSSKQNKILMINIEYNILLIKPDYKCASENVDQF